MSKLLKSKILLGFMAVAIVLVAVAVATPAKADCSLGTTTLKYGQRSAAVTCLQQTLGVTPTTGYFGKLTLAKVKAFQADNGLTADGKVGSMTKAKMTGTTGTTGGTSGTVSLCPNGMTLASNCTTPPSTVTPPTVTDGMVSAVLATDNPIAGNVVAGQAIADLAHFTFKNGTSAPVAVTSVSLTRTGYSVDADLPNVYLYNGNVRLSDSATVSAGKVTFNDVSGLFTIPANGTLTVAVKADIVAAFGGTVGVTLTSFTAGTTVIPVTLAGNMMYGITVTTTTVDFPSQTVQPTSSSAAPTTDYTFWSANVNIGTNDVLMKSFRLRQIGSVIASDLQNFKLYVNGVQAGSTVASLGSDGYVTFDLSAAPVTLKSGTRTLKVVGDIVGGSSRTFSFSLRAASDLNVADSQVGINVLPTYNSLPFAPMSSTSATIDPGTLTFSKATDSPSSTLVLGGSNVLLGKWDVKAYGEQMKVESLYVRVIPSVAGTTSLRNGKFMLNGVQIGSTANVSTAAAGTQYTFGSAFVVTPGTPAVLEFYADNYAATGTAVASGDTFQAVVCNAACNAAQTGSNVQRKVSLTYGSYPSAVSYANTLTATVGTMTMAKDQAYGNQTIVVPKTALLLGQFTLTSGSSDTVNADTITATINSTTPNASADVTSLYVTYGTKQTNTKASITTAGSGVDSVNTWSIGETIPANTTMTFKVYGDVASAATSGSITTKLLVSGTSSSSSAVTTGTITGQVMSPASSGVLTVTLDSGTPVSTQVVAGTTQTNGSLRVKLAGTNEDIYVKKVKLMVDTVANSTAISSVDLMMATSSGGTYTKVGESMTVVNDGTNPGYVVWNLSGAGRILVARNSSVYLKAVPTYVSSGQTAVTGKTPKLLLADLQAEGTSTMSASGTGANLVNASGIVYQANGSATYVDSGADTVTTAQTAVATSLVTTDGTKYSIGDVIFVDENADGTWDPASEELETVVLISTNTLTVQRASFGTTANAYSTGKNIYRLSGTASTYTNASIIGNAMTVLNTKLGLSLGSNSPSGATSAGTAKLVFAFTVAADNNAADVALNTATLNYVDITTVRSSASINDLKVYPSEYDTNATYATTCGALSSTKWRCAMSTAGDTNKIDENTSRTYIVRGNTAYDANGSLDISIAALGTSSAATNDIKWTDGTTTQYWTTQASTSVTSPAPLSSAVASGTKDVTKPTISSIVVANGSGTLNTVDNGDTITLTFSEVVDPTTINASLVPGGSVTGVAAASTGGLTGVAATGVATITNITTFTAGATFAGAVSSTTDLALDSTGKILTITLNTGTSRAVGTPGMVAGTTATTVADANSNVMAAAASPLPTGSF